MLKTEQNTPAMKQRIVLAAQKKFRDCDVQADFAHGQWWVTLLPDGSQYSVIDAEGPGSVYGFDFEQVS